jgi:hypothetical protein
MRSGIAVGIAVTVHLTSSARKMNLVHCHRNPALEVRHYIADICKGPPRAQHDFASYNPQEKRWRINLEYLECNGGHGLEEYRRGSQCLDVDFVAVGSHWRLARKAYADCGF